MWDGHTLQNYMIHNTVCVLIVQMTCRLTRYVGWSHLAELHDT